MIGFLEILIKPKIIEIMTYRIVEHTRTFTVVVAPINKVGPCSPRNSKYVIMII
jgi:hypothetical protein